MEPLPSLKIQWEIQPLTITSTLSLQEIRDTYNLNSCPPKKEPNTQTMSASPLVRHRKPLPGGGMGSRSLSFLKIP